MELEDIMLSKRSQAQKGKYPFSKSVESKLEKMQESGRMFFGEKERNQQIFKKGNENESDQNTLYF